MSSSFDRDSAWAATRVSGDRPGPADSGWQATRVSADRPGPADGGWQSTRVETQVATRFLGDKDSYLEESGPRDIGRQTAPDTRELFVSCDPAQALEQQFELLKPSFIAVHELGTHAALRLLTGIAAAAQKPVQKLHIRRQGYGTTLATLTYLEIPTANGSTLRLFVTDSESDGASRRAIARTLLAWSRLAVVMVGEQPPHVMDAAFHALRDDILAPGWRNRAMLLLPLTSSGTVSSHGAELGRSARIAVRTTPLVTRPADAWDFITGAWARLDDPGAPPAAEPAATPARRSPPTPLEMRPMPPVPTAADRARTAASEPTTLIGRYAQRVAELPGVVACTVFDPAQGKPVAHSGSGPAAADLAQQGAELIASMLGAGRALGFGQAAPDAAITFGSHHVLLRAVPRHPQLALHVVLDKAQANLTLARLQLGRLDAMFDPA
jgi:hypothetical protein